MLKEKLQKFSIEEGIREGLGKYHWVGFVKDWRGRLFCPKTMLSCSKVTNGVLYTLSRKEEEATHIMSPNGSPN